MLRVVAQAGNVPEAMPCAKALSRSPTSVAKGTSLLADRRQAFKLATVTATLASLALSASADVEPVYFGNGCYWGRQYDQVKTEQTKLGRSENDISAVVGYAGGRKASPSGKVCYYYTNELDTIYEKLGHAEVVQVQLRDDGSSLSKEDQFREYARTYFSEFNKLKNGSMQRQDPQDAGAGYRNTVGLPGGVDSPLFKILQEENVNGMDLRPGSGNVYSGTFGQTASEGDLLNVVWVIDSNEFPFFRAEVYHQYVCVGTPNARLIPFLLA